MNKFFSFFLFFLLLHSVVCAEEYQQYCVSYEKSIGARSNKYKVSGFVVDGLDLKQFARKNGHFSDYHTYLYYIVIPWDNGGYTALPIDMEYGSNLPIYEIKVKDHYDRYWYIEKGWEYCR